MGAAQEGLLDIKQRINSMTATERLVAALEVEIKLIHDSNNECRVGADLILQRAKACVYHDFKTQLAAPKHQLVSDLRQVGMERLAQRVIEGDFDDGMDD